MGSFEAAAIAIPVMNYLDVFLIQTTTAEDCCKMVRKIIELKWFDADDPRGGGKQNIDYLYLNPQQ